MATLLLKDVMGTRYIINALDGKLMSVLDTATESGDTVDLCDCKMGPDAVIVLKSYYGRVALINSTDEELNDILTSNTLYVTEEISEYEPLNLMNVQDISVFMELREKLPQCASFKPIVDLTRILDKATLVLLMMARPDIDWDIRSCATDIYTFVRDAWLNNAGHHDTYYELIAPDTVRRDITDAGYYGDSTYGYQKESSFVRTRCVIPYAFGNDRIVKMDGSPIAEEWLPLVEKCLEMFKRGIIERKPGKTLRNLLVFREE